MKVYKLRIKMTSIPVIGKPLISTNIPGSILQVRVQKTDCQLKTNDSCASEFDSS